ncbi:GPO family capsid scaffolding protein [Vibrio cholerae]|uniref:GPO family capsid scaffolding protein n=1 Tax=Vibrio cholerae TaxID=666 RepID=UPI0000EF9BB3|nr:GPO family capsid scaffolding protein [Vibrio cholerae]KNH57320.1 phage capsid scaffolding protein [Vibrio cholerae 1587]WOQ96117.1 GPO family capsid scaffolding protein [Vibrio cholerae]
MPKTSDWKIVATEGATIDGRTLSAQWLSEMAEEYSTTEYTAMIWPEHFRFGGFGNNWGSVEALKAEKVDGKMRLFAKILPNQYLLAANKLGQKLFTSIEIQPDYKGTGKCYLRGLAVTDSPASTGTSRLEFNVQNGKPTVIESDSLEELDFSECQPSAFVNALSTLFSFFNNGEQPNETNQPQSEDEEPMKQEQFDQMMGAINGIATKQNELESKFNTFSAQKPETEGEQTEPEGDGKETNGMTPEQYNKLQETLDSIAQKQADLETKFTQLSQTGPDGQGADKSGGGEGYMPV